MEKGQYGLAKILGIWAAVTVPMALLAWVVAPWLIARVAMEPGIVYWWLMIFGMAWQCIVAVWVLRGERTRWTWVLLRRRLWLKAPRDPHGGRRGPRLFWWIVPGILFVGLTSDLFGAALDAPMRWLFPGLGLPEYADIRTLVASRFEGQWWLLGMAFVSCVFNYLLGEALLFHGVLLPRMQGVFGRHAWLANAVLFGLYHVHMLLALPSISVSNIAYSLPAYRYRSVWLAVAIHGFEGVMLLTIVTLVILGVLPGSG